VREGHDEQEENEAGQQHQRFAPPQAEHYFRELFGPLNSGITSFFENYFSCRTD
jgi:hypothetical protein